MGFYAYSQPLQSKINRLLRRKRPPPLAQPSFTSPFLLAPMAAISNAPFRLLMQELGSGGSISEFINCNGILQGNRRIREMLRIDPREQNVGIQLYGAQAAEMALAAQITQELPGVQFIDINMGCPVRKVVNRGAGAALLEDPQKLGRYLEEIKKILRLPLTIKIRTGLDSQRVNAHEVCHVARESGVGMISVHGRTRAQGYRGHADWGYTEWLAGQTPLPLVGNGDLHQAHQVQRRWHKTRCSALMIARGCLRNPFIFLESYLELGEQFAPTAGDYWEVIQRFQRHVEDYFSQESVQIVQVRKLVLWFASGFPGACEFRSRLFTWRSMRELMDYGEQFFHPLGSTQKSIDHRQDFMMSGHG